MFAKANEVKAGDHLKCDEGFTCLKPHTKVVVQEDEEGLFVSCADGKHYLDGQEDENGNLVGLYVCEAI